MKKKKSGGGGANWMDTYGDMVTLLLCFFVLLYSMSDISEEKLRALVMSFNPNAILSETEVRGGGGPSADGDQQGVAPAPEEATQEAIDTDIENLYEAIQEFISESSMEESVSVSKDGGRVFVNFNGTTFFKADSYALTAEALPVLDALCEMLTGVGNSIQEVRISGHTAQYSAEQPNNVEQDRFLAGNRATRVLIYLQTHTNSQLLDPAKLVSEEWGQWQPIADNATTEGKQLNRRVEVVISGRNLEEEMANGGNIPSYYTSGNGPAASASPSSPVENTQSPADETAPGVSTSPAASVAPKDAGEESQDTQEATGEVMFNGRGPVAEPD